MVPISKSDLTGLKPTIDPIPVPELGAGRVVYVRGMSGAERDDYQKSILILGKRRATVNYEYLTAKVVARCVVVGEADPTRVFSDSDEDLAAINAIRGDVLERIADVARRKSGLTEQDLEELGNASAKMSGSSSSSDSPGN